MSSNITPELMTVAQVARSVPGRDGTTKGLAPSTVVRWIVAGTPARNGERIKLAAVRVGGRWLVRPEDLATFFDQLASVTPSATTLQAMKKRTETQRRRASEAAAKELERKGA